MVWVSHDAYEAHLKSIRWLEEQRPAALQRWHYQCAACGARHNLQVHHASYRDPLGQERDAYLIVLCDTCHDAVTLYIKAHPEELMYQKTWQFIFETRRGVIPR